MKVRVSIELDIPDVKDENVEMNSEYVKGITWEKAFALQDIFDNFTNYAVCSHLRDAMKWLVKSKDDKTSNEYWIHAHHNQWADIISKAAPSLTVEKL
jgi:hypothetical protein